MDPTEKLEGTDVCVCLHTALRKYCDSSITSAAYNLIHLICDVADLKPKHSPWHLLGELVAEQLNNHPKLTALSATRRAVHNLDDQFYERITKPRREKGKRDDPANSRQWLYALQCTMKCFDDSDWLGAVALLPQREEDEQPPQPS